MRSLGGYFVSANCGITKPERYFIYYGHFEGIFVNYGLDELYNWCWKNRIF